MQNPLFREMPGCLCAGSMLMSTRKSAARQIIKAFGPPVNSPDKKPIQPAVRLPNSFCDSTVRAELVANAWNPHRDAKKRVWITQ